MNRSHSRGFFTIDVMTALTIVGALIVSLAVVTDRHRRAVDTLAQSRLATDIAESTLIDLQLHRQPASPADAHIEILPVDGGELVQGKRWVQVRVATAGRTATLVGLVPAEPAPATPTSREAP